MDQKNAIYPVPDGEGGFTHSEKEESLAHSHQKPSVLPKSQSGVFESALNGTASQPALKELANAQPVAVVKTLSTRGLEYVFMSIALWFGAAGLIWTLLLLVNGQTNAALLSFPITALVVCLPVFAWFFLRLKKAELNDPALRFDPSKRRLSQITQVIAYIVTLSNVIAFVYSVIASSTGNGVVSVGRAFLNLLVITTVAGGILLYYWIDEHRPLDR